MILMGYSKGAPDILSLLAARPDLAPRIKAVIGWAGAVGGSYLADGIYNQIKDIPKFDVVEDMSGKIGQLMLQLAPVVQINNINRRLDEYDIKGASTLPHDDLPTFVEEHEDLLPAWDSDVLLHRGHISWRCRTSSAKAPRPAQVRQVQRHAAHPVAGKLPLPNAPRPSMFHANHWDLSYDTFPLVHNA